MLIDFGDIFINTFFMNVCINFILTKIINYKNINKYNSIISFLLNIIICVIYFIISITVLNFKSNLITNMTFYVLYSLLLLINYKISLLYGIMVICISTSLAFVSKYIAGIINFILIQIGVFKYGICEYIILGCVQIIILYLFFSVKRFKNGFSFLKIDNYNQKTNVLGIIISIMIIFSSIIFAIYNNNVLGRFIILEIILGGIVMIWWIRKNITNYYKKRMKDRTIEMLTEQIKEKDKTIKDLKEELANILEINHKYNHRISSMERAVSKFYKNMAFNEEIAQENGYISDSLKEFSKEYKNELYNVVNSNNLPKTDVFSIDNILEYMETEANKNNIEFCLEIHSNINYMIENLISKGNLETLLGDHIKDAIIAINHSNNKYRSIKVIFDVKNEYYEIKIYDSGIEFEIETLLKLGLETVTTHKEDGGSGIGFMTTFKTLKECKASLLIEEKLKTINNSYTKAIVIIFDGKNEYRIKSYRADQIKSANQNTRLIIE